MSSGDSHRTDRRRWPARQSQRADHRAGRAARCAARSGGVAAASRRGAGDRHRTGELEEPAGRRRPANADIDHGAGRQAACRHDAAGRPGAAGRAADRGQPRCGAGCVAGQAAPDRQCHRRRSGGYRRGVARRIWSPMSTSRSRIRWWMHGSTSRARGRAMSAGSLRMTANGPVDAIAVKLSATLPDLQGAAARLSAAATLDTASRSLSVASLQGDWRQQSIRLLAPVHLGFADGVAIDQLRLGVRQAVLDVSGRVGTTLDLTASLRNLPADIAAAISPAFAADGTLQADARITGTSARPNGTVKLTATGLRARSGPGRAVPPANITARRQAERRRRPGRCQHRGRFIACQPDREGTARRRRRDGPAGKRHARSRRARSGTGRQRTARPRPGYAGHHHRRDHRRAECHRDGTACRR